MTEQKDPQAERQRRTDEATKHMSDRRLEDRARAAHPHAADSDEGTKQMLEDYDRLAKEAEQHQQQQGQQPKS